MKRPIFGLLTAIAVHLLLFAGVLVNAQCPASVVADGLKAPTKIVISNQGNLLVAEQGEGPNTGRISIIDKTSGFRRTLIDNLPSGFAAPNNDPSGPSGLVMVGRTLYMTIGAGDSVLNGNVPGVTFYPNPSPSSPLFSSILAIHFDANVERQTAGFFLSIADQVRLKSAGKLNLVHQGGDLKRWFQSVSRRCGYFSPVECFDVLGVVARKVVYVRSGNSDLFVFLANLVGLCR